MLVKVLLHGGFYSIFGVASPSKHLSSLRLAFLEHIKIVLIVRNKIFYVILIIIFFAAIYHFYPKEMMLQRINTDELNQGELEYYVFYLITDYDHNITKIDSIAIAEICYQKDMNSKLDNFPIYFFRRTFSTSLTSIKNNQRSYMKLLQGADDLIAMYRFLSIDPEILRRSGTNIQEANNWPRRLEIDCNTLK